MNKNESTVAEYMKTLSLLQRDKEEVSNLILGYMNDCQYKDTVIVRLQEKMAVLTDLVEDLAQLNKKQGQYLSTTNNGTEVHEPSFYDDTEVESLVGRAFDICYPE